MTDDISTMLPPVVLSFVLLVTFVWSRSSALAYCRVFSLQRKPILKVMQQRRKREEQSAASTTILFSAMSSSSSVSGLALFFLWLVLRPCAAIRAFPFHSHGDQQLYFAEAPQYRNGADCPAVHTQGAMASCDPSLVHIAMTLDLVYIRGTMAAVHSVLMHGSCPEDIYFHFIAASGDGGTQEELRRLLLASFPSLQFRIYTFHEDEVARLISPSVRDALDRPLNYARNHIPHLLGSCVDRVIYLDSDVILVDDIKKLWDETRDSGAVIAAPEYCNANFTSYFTEGFWRNPVFRRTFEGRRSSQPCYFNTGVMVMDLAKWRAGDYEERIRRWMEIQRRATPRIYELGSLPPFMLVFAGDVHGVDHRWNQHGLGGDNANGNCRPLHPGRVSLMHWSGKGKPWVRLDAGNPCPVDFVWKPFDLRVSSPETL